MSEQQVVPLHTIDELVHIVYTKWEKVDAGIKKVRTARLELGLVLLELRQRVEDGEVGDLAAIDWWGWYGDRFVRSRQDAEKLLAIAKAEDPQAAYETAKARGAANVRAYRERKNKLQVVTPAPAYNGDVSGASDAAPVTPPTIARGQQYQTWRLAANDRNHNADS